MAKTKILVASGFAAAAYFLSIASEATQDTAVLASYIAGGLELLLFLMAVPLANSAGKRLRRDSQTVGSTGIRLVSWIMYGVAIPHALLFFQWGLIAGGNNRIPDGQIPVNAAIFFVASMLMVADAWSSARD